MPDENRVLSLPAPPSRSELVVERPNVYQAHPEPAENEGVTLPLSPLSLAA